MIRNLVRYLTTRSYRIVEENGRFAPQFLIPLWPFWEPLGFRFYWDGSFGPMLYNSKNDAMCHIEADKKSRVKPVKIIHPVP